MIMLTATFRPRPSSAHFRATWQDRPQERTAARLGALLRTWLPEQGATIGAYENAVAGATLDTHAAWYREQPWYCRVWWAWRGCTDGGSP
jgi:hypothetical protein